MRKLQIHYKFIFATSSKLQRELIGDLVFALASVGYQLKVFDRCISDPTMEIIGIRIVFCAELWRLINENLETVAVPIAVLVPPQIFFAVSRRPIQHIFVFVHSLLL